MVHPLLRPGPRPHEGGRGTDRQSGGDAGTKTRSDGRSHGGCEVKTQSKKSQNHKPGNTARRSRNQRQDLCTTEPQSHGENQKIYGFVPDRRGFAVSKIRVSIFRTYIRVSENRGHGNVATPWVNRSSVSSIFRVHV